MSQVNDHSDVLTLSPCEALDNGQYASLFGGPDSAEFVKNRVAMQQEHMQTIWREFASAKVPVEAAQAATR